MRKIFEVLLKVKKRINQSLKRAIKIVAVKKVIFSLSSSFAEEKNKSKRKKSYERSETDFLVDTKKKQPAQQKLQLFYYFR